MRNMERGRWGISLGMSSVPAQQKIHNLVLLAMLHAYSLPACHVLATVLHSKLSPAPAVQAPQCSASASQKSVLCGRTEQQPITQEELDSMRAVGDRGPKPSAAPAAAPAAGPHYFVPGQGWVPFEVAERAGAAPEAPSDPASSARGADARSPASGGAGADPAPNPGQEAGRRGPRDAGGAAQAGAGAAGGGTSRQAADPAGPNTNNRGGWGPAGGDGADAAGSGQPVGPSAGSGAPDSKAGTPSAKPPAETAAGAAPEGGAERNGAAAAVRDAAPAQERADAAPGAGKPMQAQQHEKARQPEREQRPSAALPDVAAAEVELPEHWVDPRVAMTLQPGAGVASLHHRAAVAMRAAQVTLSQGRHKSACLQCSAKSWDGVVWRLVALHLRCLPEC